jgi:hypothetical protein
MQYDAAAVGLGVVEGTEVVVVEGAAVTFQVGQATVVNILNEYTLAPGEVFSILNEMVDAFEQYKFTSVLRE